MQKLLSFPHIVSKATVGLTILCSSLNWSRAAERHALTNRWESDIEAFEASDKTNPPPQNAILFIGSSSIRMWTDVQKAFPEHTVFRRGFGGSELSDSVEFADRIVIPYKPKMILLYAGDNDIANGKSPERVLADFKDFVEKVHVALPQTRIGYIAIKPSLARRKLIIEMKTANLLIKDYVGHGEGLLFIDVFTPMLDQDGEPRSELFIRDGLHLNDKGYALWTSIIGPVLDRYDPTEDKTR
jgi:hypothetical protein